VLKAGIWYVVATSDDQVRTYRARRIVSVRDTGAAFARPDDFDLPAHWTESIAAYERDVPRVSVTLRVQERAVHSLVDVVGARALREAEELDGGQATDGWRCLRLSLDWPDEVPGRLVAMGGAVEIVEPREIRERAVAIARELIDRYSVS
jgi:predicted DNA-binding transcriptional regulator YafY